MPSIILEWCAEGDACGFVPGAAAIDAKWDKPAWRAVAPLHIAHAMGEPPGHRPDTRVRIAYDEEAVYGIFRVEDRYVRSVATEHQKGEVSKDSCVEFLFTPGPDLGVGHFYLEMNCGGTMLFRFHGPDRVVTIPASDYDPVTVAHSLPATVNQEIREPVTWTLEYRLPVAVLHRHCAVVAPGPGVRWRANFYKCADDSSHPHRRFTERMLHEH